MNTCQATKMHNRPHSINLNTYLNKIKMIKNPKRTDGCIPQPALSCVSCVTLHYVILHFTKLQIKLAKPIKLDDNINDNAINVNVGVLEICWYFQKQSFFPFLFQFFFIKLLSKKICVRTF